MLEGKTTPTDVAKERDDAFMSDEDIKKWQDAADREYYAKNVIYDTIKMEGVERCIQCNEEQSAFCYLYKQVKHYNEPMSRFMKCNACGYMWQD